MKYYSGKFRPSNPGKYLGNIRNVKYRSLWERQVFRWCDTNGSVKAWSSEEMGIPYKCKTDGKTHIYIPDLKIIWENGETHVIEIKPKSQTLPPKPQTRKTKAYILSVLMYAKNVSKWEAAAAWCEAHDMIFAIWTEETIQNLGIKLLTSKYK